MSLGHIALFLPDLTGGGAERVMIHLARGLARRGHSVDLVLVQARGPLLAEVPDQVRLIELRSAGVLVSLRALARYLRRERPDALLSTLNTANVVAVYAARLARSGTRIVIRQANTLSRTLSASSGLHRPIRFLVRRAYPRADAVIAVSDGVARDLVELVPLDPARLRTVPSPIVTPDLFARAAEPVDHPWFDRGDVPVVLGVGRLTRQKDFPTLILAFARVARRRDARLLILGEGEERPRLEALVRALDLDGRVELPGYVDNPFPFMARAAVLVLSSAWEGLPGVIVQALALGTPVIATDCESGPREALDGGRFGLLVPVGDDAAIARGLLDLLARRPAPVPRAAWNRYTEEAALDAYLRLLRPPVPHPTLEPAAHG